MALKGYWIGCSILWKSSGATFWVYFLLRNFDFGSNFGLNPSTSTILKIIFKKIDQMYVNLSNGSQRLREQIEVEKRLLTSHFLLCIFHFTFLTIYHSLLNIHCSLLTPHWVTLLPLLFSIITFDYFSLLTLHYSFLIPHFSLLTPLFSTLSHYSSGRITLMKLKNSLGHVLEGTKSEQRGYTNRARDRRTKKTNDDNFW